MLRVTLYFAMKSTLPLQMSENSEVDSGCMPGPGCNSCTFSNCWQVKTVNTLSHVIQFIKLEQKYYYYLMIKTHSANITVILI